MQSAQTISKATTHPVREAPLLGIVGCGMLGRTLISRLTEGGSPVPSAARVGAVTSRDAAKAHAFLSTWADPPPYLPLDDLIVRCSLVVETAGGHVVPELARKTFAAGKDLLIISTGALLDHPEILEQARRSGCRLILPSGGIAAIDGLKSASRGNLERVTFIMRKAPQGWAGAPYLKANGITLEGLTAEKELFHGPVREACRGFPENVNISATVGLAGLGPDRTMLRILAVPGLKRNTHTLEIEGDFGLITMNIQNIPTENPKTGRLVAMSILRAIDDAYDPVRIGS
jgi:aspartate dehydrogenase